MIKSQNWLKGFLKEILNPGLQGINCPKKVFFYFFALYSKTALRNFQIFCMNVEDNRAHYLLKIVLLKKFFIPEYRGLGLQKRWLFLLLCILLLNSSKDLPNFLHEYRGHQGPLFEQDRVSEKFQIGIFNFGLFSKTALRIIPIFCMNVETIGSIFLYKLFF